MFDLWDTLLYAITVGVVVGVFVMVTGAFFRFGWKNWHIIGLVALALYFFA